MWSTPLRYACCLLRGKILGALTSSTAFVLPEIELPSTVSETFKSPPDQPPSICYLLQSCLDSGLASSSQVADRQHRQTIVLDMADVQHHPVDHAFDDGHSPDLAAPMNMTSHSSAFHWLYHMNRVIASPHEAVRLLPPHSSVTTRNTVDVLSTSLAVKSHAGQSALESLPPELFAMVISSPDNDKGAIMGLALASRTLWCRVLDEHILRHIRDRELYPKRSGSWAGQPLVCNTTWLADEQQSILIVEPQTWHLDEQDRGGASLQHPHLDAMTLGEAEIQAYLRAYDGKGDAFLQSSKERNWDIRLRAWLEMLLRGGNGLKELSDDAEVTPGHIGREWVLRNLNTNQFVVLKVQGQPMSPWSARYHGQELLTNRNTGRGELTPSPPRKRKASGPSNDRHAKRHVRDTSQGGPRCMTQAATVEDAGVSLDQDPALESHASRNVLAIEGHPGLTLDFVLWSRICWDQRKQSALSLEEQRCGRVNLGEAYSSPHGNWAGHAFDVVPLEEFSGCDGVNDYFPSCDARGNAFSIHLVGVPDHGLRSSWRDITEMITRESLALLQITGTQDREESSQQSPEVEGTSPWSGR